MDMIDVIDKQVKEGNENMREIEGILKTLFFTYTSFKEGSKLMDEYDVELGRLVEEIPFILRSIYEVTDKVQEFKDLLKGGIIDNLNYEQGFCIKEAEAIGVIDKDAKQLSNDVELLKKMINDRRSVKQEMNEDSSGMTVNI